MQVVTLAERPDLWPALDAPELNPGPELIYHDPVAARWWRALKAAYPDFHVALLDDARVVAHGRAIPLAWTPADDAPPDEGWDFALERGMRDHEAGRRPTVAAALWIVVATDRQGEGLSARMVRALRDVCARHRLSALLAPVRPTLKARYPLIPMPDYVTWTNAAGEPFDPWLRVHRRLGGRVLGVCARSMTITGSIEEWERWASLAMPASGRYVIDGALAPVDIDHQTGIGTYIEPNVWMRHAIEVEG
jgi:GNAT superfamily N-acetyltransferase